MHQDQHVSPHSTPAAPASDGLFIKRCANCATLLAPLTETCTSCRGTDLEALPSSGTGAIVSWQAAAPAPQEPHSDPTPSAVAIVKLDDGPRIYTWIEGEVPTPPDRPVRVRFRPTPDGARSPLFVVSPPASTAPTAAVTADAA